MTRTIASLALIFWVVIFSSQAPAVILWSEPDARLVHDTGPGVDILGGKIHRTDTNTDALYFRFHVDPLSDAYSEPYSAGFQLFEGNQPRLGVGNAQEAWGYSAFNTSQIGPFNQSSNLTDNYEFNFQSAHPEPGATPGTFRPYEVVRHDVERTIIFKVQYIPGTDDLVTVWLNPNLSRGWSEKNQPANLTTKFKANACFDQIHLVHNGNGNGWIFSDMAVATSFDDFVVERYWQTWWFTSLIAALLLFSVGATVRVMERRKYQLQLLRAEQERALERERTRIAQDLHDDLGSSLTRLTLLSGLVTADKNNPEQVEIHANKLSRAADQTVRALEEIVWAVRPGSDTLQSLIDYTTHFANELFESTSMRCRMDLPSQLPALPLPPEMRHNTFLIVKEALTNAHKPNKAASALAVSLPWKSDGAHAQVSNGFVGVNDGWTDLYGGADDRAMNWQYDDAYNGNVAQIGWLDFGTNDGTSVTFDLVLGFGPNENAAMDNADATLSANIDALQETYVSQWNKYCRSLNDQGGLADDQYYLACMTLKTMQDKSNGAMVAGLGTPWGTSSGDGNNGGYHLVWARDLFKFASALIAAGDDKSANKALDFLFNVQMQTANRDNPYSRRGRFPQNTFDDGRPYWPGTQMDECSMPIVLAWKLNRLDLWPKIKMAADFVAANGPRTDEERWEEMGGYSPSTIAAEIAGLVCAADLATQTGNADDAARYLRVADGWRNNVANWTFTTNGLFGDKKYYIRIDDNRDPNCDAVLTFGNGAGPCDVRGVVDGGFLELARLGVMSPNDWTILETLPKYDGILKQSIPGKGDAWFRYNRDGYGERNDGTPYNDGGRGRLWPIFTAERGIYEISRSGDGAAGRPYLASLKHFSSPTGFISEQIWNINASITGWETDTPTNDAPGTATGSMRPLNWAMGEYINLIAAMKNGRNDAPSIVVKRYESNKPQTTVHFTAQTRTGPGETVYLVGNLPQLGAWVPQAGVEMAGRSDSVWTATLSLPAGRSFQYKYVKVDNAGKITWVSSTNRTLTTPAKGTLAANDEPDEF